MIRCSSNTRCLSELFDELFKLNVSIHFVLQNFFSSENPVCILVISPPSTLSYDVILNRLKSLRGVEKLSAFRGFITLSNSAPSHLLSISSLWLNDAKKLFGPILEAILRFFGEEPTALSAGEYMLFRAGFSGGVSFANFIKRLHPSLNAKSLISEGFKLYDFCGWCKVAQVFLDLESASGKLVVSNSFECEFWKSRNLSVGSHFLRGHMCGFISNIIGVDDLILIEDKCISRGDPYCEFRLARGSYKPWSV